MAEATPVTAVLKGLGEIRAAMAVAYARTADPNQAIAYLKSAVQLDPSQAAWFETLADVLDDCPSLAAPYLAQSYYEDALVKVMESKGLTVEQDPSGHGLYVKVKELDWLQWGNKTVADLQNEFDAEKDPVKKKAAGQKLAAAMKDMEVCATTAGAQNKLFGTGAIDPKGSKLDHIKKFAQTDELYTKSKVTDKLLKADLGPDGYTRYINDPLNRAKLLVSHQNTTTQALRMEGLPEVLQAEARKQYVEMRTNELVESYRVSAVQHQVEYQQRLKSRDSYLQTALEFEAQGDAERAGKLRAAANQIDQDIAAIRRSNDQTFRAIAQADKGLTKRLLEADAHAIKLVNQDPEAARRAIRDNGSLQEFCRTRIDETKPTKPWLEVAKDSTTQLLDKTDAVFGAVNTIGGYASLADQAMTHQSEGKGSAVTYMAKELAKDAAKDYAVNKMVKKFPMLGSAMEIMDLPGTIMSEMEREMEEAEAKGSSLWAAKAKGVWNTVKKQSFFETFETVLNEEGMAEVDNEMATGEYSWANVAFRTASRTTAEVTQMNAIFRYGNNMA